MSADSVAPEPLEIGPAQPAEIAPGLVAVASYGRPEAEHRALRRGCGLVDRLWVDHLEVTGEDRARFLNGMVTGDTKTLAAGEGRFVFFTSAQGRVLAEARVVALADSLLLELPAGRAEPIAEHLSRYIVADRVEVAPRPDLRSLGLVGPAAAAAAARVASGAKPPVDRWSALEAEWEGAPLILAREERLGGPAFTVRVTERAAQAVAAGLVGDGGGGAPRPVGFLAAEALRIEAGMARFGPDFGDERFPQEVGETDALDFEKGCYLGQEVVARIHYRGKVNHRLCGLRLGEAEPPPAGGAVTLAGEPVGRAGSAARSPRVGETIALAVLHRKAEIGVAVEAAGLAAEVVELPFVVD